jgi:hypothetical protein
LKRYGVQKPYENGAKPKSQMSREIINGLKMKNITHFLNLFFLALFLLSGCNSESNKRTKAAKEEIKPNQKKELSDDFLGNYHGIQQSYYMKNQYGDEMIIAGNKVPVPSSNFKFLLKKDNVASLQQTNLEDNQRYYYDGSYMIIDDETDLIKVEISLSDGQGSSPTYIIEINKSAKIGNCIGKNEPVFNISKIN